MNVRQLPIAPAQEWLALILDVANGRRKALRARVSSALAATGGGAHRDATAARVLLLGADFDAALAAIDRAAAAVEEDDERDDVLIARTFAQGMLGDFQSAMEGFATLAERNAPPLILLAAVELAARVEATDTALDWARRLQGHPAVTGLLLLRLAEVLRDIGMSGAAVDLVRRALLMPDVDRMRAAQELLACGDCDGAESLFRAELDGPQAAAAHRGLATLHLWRRQTAAAVAQATAQGDLDDCETRRIRAAADVLDGRIATALPVLDDLAVEPTADCETLVWRAEALLRAGRLRAAVAAIRAAGDRSPDANSYAALGLIETLVAVRRGRRPIGEITTARAITELCGPEAYAELRDLIRRVAFRRFLLVDRAAARGTRLLRAWGFNAPRIAAPREVATVIERALDALGGNRSFSTPTLLRDGALRPLRLPPPPRSEAKTALHAVRIGGFAAAHQRLTALIERYPDWPQPWFYRAELHLWVSDLDSAERDLETALAMKGDPEIQYGRWPRIGLAAVYLLRGNPRAAQRMLWAARWHGGAGPAEPYFAWRGEVLRALGRLQPARTALERVCGDGSCRVGSLVTLALLYRDLGDRERPRAILTRVAALAPPLMLEVTGDPSRSTLRACLDPDAGVERLTDDEVREVLERAGTAMRGNRSAGCLTYVDAQNQLRAIPPNRFYRFVQIGDEVAALRPMLSTQGSAT